MPPKSPSSEPDDPIKRSMEIVERNKRIAIERKNAELKKNTVMRPDIKVNRPFRDGKMASAGPDDQPEVVRNEDGSWSRKEEK